LSSAIIVFPILIPIQNADAATIRAEATPEIVPGVIELGQRFTIDIYE
jgi:hypothetical protein